MAARRKRKVDWDEVRKQAVWTFPQFARAILGRTVQYLYPRVDPDQQVIHLPQGDLPYHVDPFRPHSRVVTAADWRRLEQSAGRTAAS